MSLLQQTHTGIHRLGQALCHLGRLRSLNLSAGHTVNKHLATGHVSARLLGPKIVNLNCHDWLLYMPQ